MTDLDGRAFVRRRGALHPADIAADEFLESIPDGREVIITARRPRSVKHHRLMFGLLRKVVSNSDDFNDEDELLDAVKIAVGHTAPRLMLDGTVVRVPKSINFASMDQSAFKRFFDRALYVLARLLGVDPMALLAEVMSEMRHVESPPTAPSHARQKERA